MSIDGRDKVSRPAARIRSAFAFRSWGLWSQRPRVIAYCLTSDACAAAVTAFLFVKGPVTARDGVVLAALATLGLLQAELSRGVERMRRRVSRVAHINMTSVWTFAAVLMLPPELTAVLVVILYWHLAARSWYRIKRVPMWRTVNNASLVILTCYAAQLSLAFSGVDGIADAMHRSWEGLGAVGLATAVYFVVGALIVIPARDTIARTWEGLFDGWAENLLELATLCLGALTALAGVAMPGLALAILPPLLMLHRAVLVKQLEVAATTDDKTGVLNTAGWHHIAQRELERSKQRGISFGLLMIDLDFFKRINDDHGHLAGDEVLKAVAAVINHEVRDRDAVGRFGGEEFVVLLPDIDQRNTVTVAERIRHAIAELEVAAPHADTADGPVTIRKLSASIGVALYPTSGHGLQQVLDAADTALYQAKHAGRNRVAYAEDPGAPAAEHHQA